MSGIETRIEAVASLYESRKQAAATAGVALSSLQRWINGEGMPAFDSLAALAAAQKVSLDWLASGLGEMYAGKALAVADGEQDVYAYVPLYDARVSAGYGAWNEHARILTHLAFTRESLRRKGLDLSKLSAIRVAGDSMEGTLKDGDTVLIEHDLTTLVDGGIYVVWAEHGLMAKRLQRDLDGSLMILSDNPRYNTITVPKGRIDEVYIVGQVIWSATWLI